MQTTRTTIQPTADDDFRNWLNFMDATLGYECRRKLRTVAEWRVIFDEQAADEAFDATI
jgi:hypothetical protein